MGYVSRPPRDYYDKEKLRKKRETLALLKDILEHTASEDDFVQAVKGVNPEISPDELIELIKLFRAFVREKRGLDRGRS
jgi:hypothetical protein